MAQVLTVLSNSGGTGTGNGTTSYPGPGVTKAIYKEQFTFALDGTHTAQTLYPIGVITRPGVIAAVTCGWLEVNAANTTLATVDVLKRSIGASSAGTSVLGTVATLSNNATAQAQQSVSTAFALTQNAGGAAVRPVLSTTAATLAVAAGDQLMVTTTATSTQGVDLCCTVEILYYLNDEVASTNLI